MVKRVRSKRWNPQHARADPHDASHEVVSHSVSISLLGVVLSVEQMLIFGALMLKQLLIELEQDRSKLRSFTARCLLSERLEVLALAEPAMQPRAAGFQTLIDSADERFFRRVRARLRHGMFTRTGLIRSLQRHAAREEAHAGYAPLDVLLAGVLDAGPLPDELPRSPEMVAYQPAPGRIILALLEQLRPGVVFYDLGSGLGRVVIVAALLTAARAKGVEFQPSFCAYSAQAAERLNAQAEFIALDAREAELADGDVFFLYTPFRGALLQSVLTRLRAIAEHKPIRVCTFGPCTPEVAQSTWLELQSGSLSHEELAVFSSRKTPHRSQGDHLST